ncbi:hypothetical protein HanRHA438_Chr17g0820681 [Helianthus annuus]|nr:hypothetical protein HanRHA438_Chr17g0820681 [Helianthus annuus]
MLENKIVFETTVGLKQMLETVFWVKTLFFGEKVKPLFWVKTDVRNSVLG